MLTGTAAINTASFFVALASVSWSAAFAWSRWLTARQSASSGDDRIRHVNARLQDLELSANETAVEIERIGEMQRFLLRSTDVRDGEARHE